MELDGTWLELEVANYTFWENSTAMSQLHVGTIFLFYHRAEGNI